MSPSQHGLFGPADEDGVSRRAAIEGAYRWALSRTWNSGGRHLVFLMLNPSTADAAKDDPTIRRCMGFGRAWGYGGIAVVNLYALRSSEPAALYQHPDPIGARNVRTVLDIVEEADVILAWGANPGPRPDHVFALQRAVRHCASRVDVLGWCSNGHPRHPLFVRASAERVSISRNDRPPFYGDLPHADS